MKTVPHVALLLSMLLTACAQAPATAAPSPIPPATRVAPTTVAPATATVAPPSPTAPQPTHTPAPPTETPLPAPTATALPAPETLTIFQTAMEKDAQRYQFALDHGARFVTAPDARAFYIIWYPPGASAAEPPPMIATIHGHGSYAFDEFFLWQPYAQERGYGIIALQWWFGTGEKMEDYYLPHEVYEVFASAFTAEHIRPGTVLFHGFSRGSANSYGVTAIDNSLGQPYFALTISNAGKPGLDFPINGDIVNGKFGDQPFAGAHWVMVCGMHDPHPDRDGCDGMREARDWVIQYGATVDLLIEDPNGDHGAFHMNPDNVNAALDVFAARLALVAP